MAITGISYSERHWLVSKNDPDADPAKTLDENREAGATIFHYGAIPNVIMARIQDQMQTSTVEVGEMMKQTFNQKTAARNREAFKWGIREPGFENFCDEEGHPIQPRWEQTLEMGMPYMVLSEETLNQVRLSTMQEIGAEIFNRNSLSEQQRKNLEAALSRFDASPDGNALAVAVEKSLKGDANDTQSSTQTSRGKTKRKTSTGKTPSRAKKDQPAPVD
jgi:hypothetical protein